MTKPAPEVTRGKDAREMPEPKKKAALSGMEAEGLPISYRIMALFVERANIIRDIEIQRSAETKAP